MKSSGAKKIAERYVKALFDVSGKSQPQVEKDLSALLLLIAESDEFRHLLSNPLLTRLEQAKIMDVVLTKIKADELTHRFMRVVAKQKRLPLLPEIISLYQERAAHARGEMKAEVVSAEALKASDVKAISEKLGEIYGKKILLETKKDKELLGGLVVKIGSLQLDSSLSGKLTRLKNTLKAA